MDEASKILEYEFCNHSGNIMRITDFSMEEEQNECIAGQPLKLTGQQQDPAYPTRKLHGSRINKIRDSLF